MLRHYITDEKFKKALKVYLGRYSYKAVETDDLCKVLEEVSGKSLQRFFNQWLYRAGHPELEIEYSLEEKEGKEEEDYNKLELKIKITQAQEGSDIAFEFPLEVRLVLSNDNNDKRPETIQVSQKVTEYTHDIPKDVQIKWISIDPEFKILKEIKSLKITEEKENFSLKDMLTNQLKGGKTVFERIQASRILKDKKYSEYDGVISTLQEVVVLKDNFYGVSVEAANTLGSYNDKSDYSKNDKAYQALKKCLDKQTFSRLAAQVKRVVVSNIGGFERHESLDRLIEILQDQSYFVESEAATAIGKCSRNLPPSENSKKMEMIDKLKNLVDTTKTFQNLLAQGAINGLKEFSKDKNMNVIGLDKIANFLIGRTMEEIEYNIRLVATSALGKFLVTKNEAVIILPWSFGARDMVCAAQNQPIQIGVHVLIVE
jgi:aminopeptidase N